MEEKIGRDHQPQELLLRMGLRKGEKACAPLTAVSLSITCSSQGELCMFRDVTSPSSQTALRLQR